MTQSAVHDFRPPQQLAESDEPQLDLLRAAFEMATDGMIITSGDPLNNRPYVILYANPSYCRMAGYTAAELIGQPPKILHGPDTCAVVYDRMKAALSGSHASTETLLHYRQDGTTFWDEVTLAPIPDASGRVTHYLGLHRDVTLKRQHGQARLAAERHLRLFHSAFSMASDGMIITGGDIADNQPFRIVYANDSYCRMVGYTAAELMQQPPTLLSGPETCQASFAQLAAGIAAGRVASAVLLQYRKDGSTFFADITAAPVHDNAGTVTHYLGLYRDVTQQRLADQVRRADEERLRLLNRALDMASDGIIITEGAHPFSIIYVNDSFCRTTGYPAAELIGQSPILLQGNETDAATMRAVNASLRAGRATSFVVENYCKDGSVFSVALDIAPITDAASRATHFVAVQRDITVSLREQRKQREADESFRLLFDDNPLPMMVLDSRTERHLRVNQAAVDFYGWSREEFLAMPVGAIKPPGVPLNRRLMAGELTMSDAFIGVHRKADGTIVRMKVASQRHPSAGAGAVLAVLWDVTELHSAHEALDRNYHDLQRLAGELRARTDELTDTHRLAHLGSWWVSANRLEMTWSDELYAIIGRARDEFPPSWENSIQVIHPDDRDLFRRSSPVPGSRTASRAVEARLIRPDGRPRHVRIEFRPVSLDNEGAGLFGYTQDITESWEAQQALMRSEKLAILGHLTGGIAHDFNNLLTVVTLNIEEVIAELPPTGDLHGLLGTALQSAQRGADLTAQLLAYARQAPLRPQAISLAALLTAATPLIRRAVGHHYEVRVTVDDESCTPLVDPIQLQTAMLNVALNARDAMPGGGVIEIRGSSLTLPSADFALGDVPAGRYAMISLTDTGSGIAPDVLGHIFEPFYTTKPSGTASGLGLSMVDGFVGQSGGRTLVRTGADGGTSLMMFLPLITDEAAPRVPERALSNRPRALIVEDQPAVLATVSRMFTQLGYEVCAVEHAAAALGELDRGLDFAVLFTDVVLPGDMDGLGLAREVSRRAPAIRILLTSGFSQYNLPETGVPGVKVLMKPYKRQDLLDRLIGLNAH